MREITTHKVDGFEDGVTIEAYEDGPPGYRVRIVDQHGCTDRDWIHLYFGPYGFTNEALLAIVADRLEKEDAKYYTLPAHGAVLRALDYLNQQTKQRPKRRLSRAVEGTPAK